MMIISVNGKNMIGKEMEMKIKKGKNMIGIGDRSPKSWAIEVSNDNSSLEIIDEQNDCSYLNGSLLTHTFHIQKQQNKKIRYIRMRSTGPCWNGQHYLNVGRFEIYGILI